MTGLATTSNPAIEYAVADSSYLLRVPEGIDATEAAPILCAGTTVYRALKVANIQPGGWVAIVGSGGGLGHLYALRLLSSCHFMLC